MRVKRIAEIIVVLVVAIITAALAVALPTGPSSISVINTTRVLVTPSSNVSAQAGNVTELNMDANGITQTWQGYFGNVSGTIVLGNSNNQTLYNWNAISTNGEIYATRNSSTPNWPGIRCANMTNLGDENTALGIDASTDADAVNRTFLNTTSISNFYVGPVYINTSQNCFATRLFNSTGQQSDINFAEVLLHDDTSLIYTGLLEQNAVGFDNRAHHFEMLVGENGHSGDVTPTIYYFYLELG